MLIAPRPMRLETVAEWLTMHIHALPTNGPVRLSSVEEGLAMHIHALPTNGPVRLSPVEEGLAMHIHALPTNGPVLVSPIEEGLTIRVHALSTNGSVLLSPIEEGLLPNIYVPTINLPRCMITIPDLLCKQAIGEYIQNKQYHKYQTCTQPYHKSISSSLSFLFVDLISLLEYPV